MPTPTTRVLFTGAAALLALGLAGCSSDSTSSSATTAATSAAASPSASSALCTDADAVQASLATLTSTEVLKDGTDALKANFDAFEASLQTLVTSAQTEFATESAAVKTSVDSLKTAIGNLADSPSVADAAAVAAALKPVQESVNALLTAVRGAC